MKFIPDIANFYDPRADKLVWKKVCGRCLWFFPSLSYKFVSISVIINCSSFLRSSALKKDEKKECGVAWQTSRCVDTFAILNAQNKTREKNKRRTKQKKHEMMTRNNSKRTSHWISGWGLEGVRGGSVFKSLRQAIAFLNGTSCDWCDTVNVR